MNPSKGGSSDILVGHYLRELSCHTVLRLYRRLLPDFALFNYDIESLLHWVEGGRGCDINKFRDNEEI